MAKRAWGVVGREVRKERANERAPRANFYFSADQHKSKIDD